MDSDHTWGSGRARCSQTFYTPPPRHFQLRYRGAVFETNPVRTFLPTTQGVNLIQLTSTVLPRRAASASRAETKVLAPPLPRNVLWTRSFSTTPRNGPVSEEGMASMTTPITSDPFGREPGSDSLRRMKMRRLPSATSAMRSFHQARSFSWDRGGRNVAMVRSWVMQDAWMAAR